MPRSKSSRLFLLKLDHDDEKRELEFELAYLASLTVEERFRMMHDASRRMLETLIRLGHRKPSEIVKRP